MKRLLRPVCGLLCLVLLLTSLASCAHVHSYGEEWSTSEEMHWKADTCGHDTKSEEAYHTFDTKFVCTVCAYAKKDGALSVAQAVKSAPDGAEIVVEGYYVGISDEGAGLEKELLLKGLNIIYKKNKR